MSSSDSSSDNSSSDGEDSRTQSQDIFARLAELRAADPNRKRKREEILERIKGRKAQSQVSLISSARLNLSQVHSKLAGPRLTWDWRGSGSTAEEESQLEIDADQFGGSTSRTALAHHIKVALSQQHAKELGRQISSQRHQPVSSPPIIESAGILPNLLKSGEESDSEPPELIQMRSVPFETEPIINSYVTAQDDSEELEMENIPKTQIYIRNDIFEDSHKPDNEELLKDDLNNEANMASPVSRSLGDTSEESEVDSHNEAESEHQSEEEGISADESKASEAEGDAPAAPPAAEKERQVVDVEARKKRMKERKREMRRFLEAEAEESSDDDMRGLTGRRKKANNSGDEEDDDDSEEEGDLEGLVAGEEEEKLLASKAGRDARKLAKLHASWAEEHDEALQRAVENKQFRPLRRDDIRLAGLGSEEAGISRLQRKRDEKLSAIRQMYDSFGNKIWTGEQNEEESSYDSMELDSDVVTDSGEDENNRSRANQSKDKDRDTRLKEYRKEMLIRRKELKIRREAEKKEREKNSIETEAGLNTLNQSERSLFAETVSRTGLFGMNDSQCYFNQKRNSSSQQLVFD